MFAVNLQAFEADFFRQHLFFADRQEPGELGVEKRTGVGIDGLVIEENNLLGIFFNGVYQGRMTSPYSDELIWDLTTPLKSEHFQEIGPRLTEKDLKRKKNLATLEGNIFVSCECRSGFLIFNASAIFRKTLSWWFMDIPVKTKSIIFSYFISAGFIFLDT